MTELKTLKEFEDEVTAYSDGLQVYVRVDELKAEAIKRAKLYTYKANQKGIEDNEIRYWTARRIEVIEFNNLTEEELLNTPQSSLETPNKKQNEECQKAGDDLE